MELPEQKLCHTEWFHGDCLADYYGVEVFSPGHWQALEGFIQAAARCGVNMLLTPQWAAACIKPSRACQWEGEKTSTP